MLLPDANFVRELQIQLARYMLPLEKAVSDKDLYFNQYRCLGQHIHIEASFSRTMSFTCECDLPRPAAQSHPSEEPRPSSLNPVREEIDLGHEEVHCFRLGPLCAAMAYDLQMLLVSVEKGRGRPYSIADHFYLLSLSFGPLYVRAKRERGFTSQQALLDSRERHSCLGAFVIHCGHDRGPRDTCMPSLC